MDQKSSGSNFVNLPGAIIIAAALISIAIIWTKRPINTDKSAESAKRSTIEINMRPITEADHLLGNPQAPIILVEYSDTSCPFCKAFMPTMEKVMDKYGKEGKVAWVYRHFPLDTPDSLGRVLHPKANKEGQAMECAGSLGGQTAFWAYTKRIYEITPTVTGSSPDGLDAKQLPEIAKYVGLDTKSFNECLASEKFKNKVEADKMDGFNAGVGGTPYSILVLAKPAPQNLDKLMEGIRTQYGIPENGFYITSDRTKIAMSGALPYEIFSSVFDNILMAK